MVSREKSRRLGLRVPTASRRQASCPARARLGGARRGSKTHRRGVLACAAYHAVHAHAGATLGDAHQRGRERIVRAGAVPANTDTSLSWPLAMRPYMQASFPARHPGGPAAGRSSGLCDATGVAGEGEQGRSARGHLCPRWIGGPLPKEPATRVDPRAQVLMLSCALTVESCLTTRLCRRRSRPPSAAEASRAPWEIARGMTFAPLPCASKAA